MGELIQTIGSWLNEVFVPYGGWGLLVLSFVDSSFLPLPQMIDLLLIALCIAKPEGLLFYGFMATLGQVIGSAVFYFICKKGGETVLKKKLSEGKIARAKIMFEKYDMVAIIMAALLPAPFSFKAFVLPAGAFQLKFTRFCIATFIGKAIRFYSEGLLAVFLGKKVIDIMKEQYPVVVFGLVGLILMAFIIRELVRRRRKAVA